MPSETDASTKTAWETGDKREFRRFPHKFRISFQYDRDDGPGLKQENRNTSSTLQDTKGDEGEINVPFTQGMIWLIATQNSQADH